MFKGVLGRTDYRALYRQEYTMHDEEGHLAKVHGAPGAPQKVTIDMVLGLYKYSSGSKEFISLSMQKHFTTTVDGISLKKEH